MIAVEVLRYPLAFGTGNLGMFRTATPGLYISGALETNASWKCRTRKNYAIGPESEYFAPLMIYECCAGESETKNWRCAGYDDSSWENATPYTVAEVREGSVPGDLHKRPIPSLYLKPCQIKTVIPRNEEETIRAWEAMISGQNVVTIPAHTKTTVELSAGELVCGYLSLRMQKGAGATIQILQSESYVQPGKNAYGAPKKLDRLDWKNGHLEGFQDVYRVSGYGLPQAEECYEPYWIRTFRFLQITIETGDMPILITGLDYLKTGYPLEVQAKATTSDPTMAGIWDISLRSLQLCMHETYLDCPFYEQLQYAMDSRNEILYTYLVSGDDRLARVCMDSLRRSQREDGMINCCYPNYGPNIIPGFGIYYIMMVYDHMMYFGDQKLVRKHLPCIDGILNYFDTHLEARGLVGKLDRYWSFIDWAAPWEGSSGMPPAVFQGPLTMESLLYVMGLQHAAKLCSYIGRESTAQEYLNRASHVQCAVNAYCKDENGIYLDGPGVYEYSQHCQMFAVLTDTAEPTQWKRLMQKTLDEPERFAQYTVASAFYLFRALEKAGMYAQTEHLWDTWRQMLEKNLTTCTENETSERSDCHAWGALILYELPAIILGARPAAPGFASIEVSPNPGYLDWAKGTVATKWGPITVAWEKDSDGALQLQVDAEKEILSRIVKR